MGCIQTRREYLAPYDITAMRETLGITTAMRYPYWKEVTVRLSPPDEVSVFNVLTWKTCLMYGKGNSGLYKQVIAVIMPLGNELGMKVTLLRCKSQSLVYCYYTNPQCKRSVHRKGILLIHTPGKDRNSKKNPDMWIKPFISVLPGWWWAAVQHLALSVSFSQSDTSEKQIFLWLFETDAVFIKLYQHEKVSLVLSV